ncbi:MAG: branched-chain amino acid ABC transporter permease [Pseudomonadota bacterium]
MSFLQSALLLGLIEAAPLILAAMGFTLIYYLSGFINVAYAETVTFGAFAAVILTSFLGLSFYAAIIPASLLAGGLSTLTYLGVYRPAERRGIDLTEMIILSVGVSFALRYAALLLAGPDLYYFDTVSPNYYAFLGVGITSFQIAALVLVTLLAGALYVFIYRTKFGEMIRALADNRELALASGISPRKVSGLVWFIAGVVGGLAGVFYGVFSFVNTYVGWNLILIIMMVSIVGGIGSIRGAIVASLIVGILTSAVSLVLSPIYGEILLLSAFIVYLKFRQRKG